MVTSDQPIMAKAIARTAGVISEGSYTREDVAEQEGIPLDQVNPTYDQLCSYECLSWCSSSVCEIN